ncbi:hypothetical protein EST38_g5570 [Candolleomyces aberdarensis]|uniref:Uncharacterized protein n=1 Tax=Candolleomyces aberdarensis TaxID=2316362 RepID=A0A4Q2DLU3_9AGAR|nr:hypothetical protein EST38_g5570 [Candolleomyces aberdarensis]
MPALPPSPTSTSAQASSVPTQPTSMDSTQSTTWRDTFGTALASCVPSSSSSCFPCLRRVPSDDSLLDHHNSNPSSTTAPTSQSQPQRSRPPSNSTPFPNVSHGIPRARPDELQGLLSDPTSGSSSDSDVERVSLHSNFGRNRHRRKKKRNGGGNKKITLFGFDLFNVTGSRKAKPAPITLGDEDDAIYGTIGEGGASNSATPTPTSTGSVIVPHRKKNISITTANTFDSDAAPLNTALIEELVASGSGRGKAGATTELVDVRGSEEGEELVAGRKMRGSDRQSHSPSPTPNNEYDDDDDPHSQALFDTPSTKKSKSKRSRSHTSDKTSKETRVRLERERLHLERLKQQGVLPEDGDGEEFEGFQGSGSNVPGVASLADVLKGRVGSAGGSGSRSSSSSSTTSSGGMGDAGVGEEQMSGKGGRSRAAPSTSGAPTTTTASQDPAPSRANEPYGAFVQAVTTLVNSTVGGAVAASSKDDGEDDDVDLDGSVYAGPTRRSYPHGGFNGGSGSQSRSRNGSTSTGTGAGGAGQRDLRIPGSGSGSGHGRNASVGGSSHSSARLGHSGHRRQGSGLSNELGPGLQHHHYSMPPSPLSPHPPTPASDPLSGPDPLAPAKKTKKSKSSRSKSTTGSRTAKSHSSNASTSQSTSLASPVSPTFGPDSQAFVVSPSTVEQGLGFFDAEDFAPPTPPPAASPFGSEFLKAQRGGGGGFPSTGFGMMSSGSSRFGARKNRDAVAFLSKTGEDDRFGGADGL